MTRSIITDTTNEEQKAAAPAASQQAVQGAQFAATESHRLTDTLAGAFPAWDLVPMVHFVRRVK